VCVRVRVCVCERERLTWSSVAVQVGPDVLLQLMICWKLLKPLTQEITQAFLQPAS